MAFTTRSFSFISLSHPSPSSSPYSPPTSSKSRSKQPKYPRKDRFKPKSKRNYPNKQEQEQEQNLLEEVSKGRDHEECPCPSCMYPDEDSGGSESSSSSSSFDNHDIDSEESLNIVGVANGGKLFEQRKREAGGVELRMKWGLAWLRGRGSRGRGHGYGCGYEYGEINTSAGVSRNEMRRDEMKWRLSGEVDQLTTFGRCQEEWVVMARRLQC